MFSSTQSQYRKGIAIGAEKAKSLTLHKFILMSGCGLILISCSHNSSLIGFGAYTPSLNTLSKNANSELHTFSPFSYPLSFRWQQKSSIGNWAQTLESNPLALKSTDKGMDQYHSQFKASYAPAFFIADPFSLSLTSGFHGNILVGRGKNVTLSNGTQTLTFVTPGYTRIVKTFNVGSEIAFAIGKNILYVQAVAIESPFAKARRQWGLQSSIFYRWGGKTL